MNIEQIELALSSQIAKSSGLDQHRNYLGISKIGDCPLKVYREFLHGSPEPTEANHRFCYAGYHQEADILEHLKRAGIALPMTNGWEVTAPMDERLRGHIDGLTTDGALLEIKSLSMEKYLRVKRDGRALYRHYVQVQLYMRYGGWKQAFVVYRCRETYEHFIVRVVYQPATADKFERKAAMILAAIDNHTPPACECGHCEDA